MNNTKKNLTVYTLTLNKGGAETIVYNMLPFLEKQYNVTLCLHNNIIKYPINKSIKLKIISKKQRSGFLNTLLLPVYALRYKRILKENKCDVSLTFLDRPSFTACICKILGFKGNVIIAENTTASEWYPKNTLSGKTGRILLKLLYPKATNIICCSKYVQYDLLNNVKVKTANSSVIYNGVPFNEIIEVSTQTMNELDSSIFHFIHLGSFYEVKNHKLLVEAFHKMYKDSPCKLILIGKGENKTEIDRYTKELGIEDIVLSLGFVDNPYKYLASANCFVLSSNFEGLPTVLIEAMSLGLPVVSTDCFSGPREIMAPESDFTSQLSSSDKIQITNYGVLSPVKNSEALASAMRYVYDNRIVFKERREEIEQRAKFFSIENMAAGYIEAIG